MNKEEIIFWLKHFAEHPTGFKGYEDGEWKREINLYSVFNYLLELKCKVNQLESTLNEIIDWKDKNGNRYIYQDSLGEDWYFYDLDVFDELGQILDKVGGSNE